MDAYSDQSLATNERILYRARLSVVFLALDCGILGALGIFFLITAWPLGIIVLFADAVVGGLRYLAFRSTDFALTNRRVLAKQGVIRRRSIELFLSQVESVAIKQGLFGRLFGWGTLTVSGTGGTREAFRGISQPLQFRKQVQDQVVIVRQEDRH